MFQLINYGAQSLPHDARLAAANAETRRRIVDAAITLHAEKGVLGTSWSGSEGSGKEGGTNG